MLATNRFYSSTTSCSISSVQQQHRKLLATYRFSSAIASIATATSSISPATSYHHHRLPLCTCYPRPCWVNVSVSRRCSPLRGIHVIRRLYTAGALTSPRGCFQTRHGYGKIFGWPFGISRTIVQGELPQHRPGLWREWLRSARSSQRPP